jgi:hypothetical protein
LVMPRSGRATAVRKPHRPITLRCGSSEPATTTVSVKVTVAGGTATAGSDFKKAFTKTLTFKPGQWQKALVIPVLPDVDVEDDETVTVTVTLSDPTGGLAVGRETGTVSILNDD